MLTAEADQEPMLQVQIENRDVPMKVDTGATYTCVNPNYASNLPLSGKYTKTVGFSGQMKLNPRTAPVRLTVKENSITLPILVSEQTPVNLLGRDALSKLGIQNWCSPQGIYVDKI